MHTTLVIFALLAVSTAGAFAADSTGVDQAQPRIALYLPRVVATADQVVDTLTLSVQAGSSEVAGFDLKIGCDSRLVSILEILPGEIPDSCRWEYFDARDLYDQYDPLQPFSLWKVIGLAKASPGPEKPECLGFDRKAGLVDIVVAYDAEAFTLDTSVSLFFYWEECRDNVISDKKALKALMSHQVFNYYGSAMEPEEGFPSRTGSPRQCIDMTKRNHPLRVVDFHNGGVEFTLIGTEGTADSSAVSDTATSESE
ncbi:hypothetical protein KQH82_01520 [bacterium]|nr:hypothetical protein [bacterium]